MAYYLFERVNMGVDRRRRFVARTSDGRIEDGLVYIGSWEEFGKGWHLFEIVGKGFKLDPSYED